VTTAPPGGSVSRVVEIRGKTFITLRGPEESDEHVLPV
jgi:hypothetical protein